MKEIHSIIDHLNKCWPLWGFVIIGLVIVSVTLCACYKIFLELIVGIKEERTCPKSWHGFHAYIIDEKTTKRHSKKFTGACKHCGDKHDFEEPDYPGYDARWVSNVVGL